MTQYSLDRIFVLLLVLLFLMLVPQGAMQQARAQVSGKQLLQQLIEGARKEGQIDYFPVPDLGTDGARAVGQAFNKRFGLNIRMNADVSSSIAAVFSKAIVETKTGLAPTFDVLYGPDHRVLELRSSGGVERIENWEALLREISPEAYAVREKVSPVDAAGYGFLFANRIKCLNYNTDLISEAELPQTTIELGNPKYKDMYPLSPFVTDAEFGPLVYPKDRWMEIVRTWGALNPPIMSYRAGVQRMLLGEFKFMPSNAEYVFEAKAKNPKTPIGLAFFRDLTANSYVFHMMRKAAKHPNAAILFTLWATTPDANRLFEVEYPLSPNLVLGSGPHARSVNKTIKEKSIKVVSWWDSKETVEKLLWYQTEEGQKYVKELSKVRTGRN